MKRPLRKKGGISLKREKEKGSRNGTKGGGRKSFPVDTCRAKIAGKILRKRKEREVIFAHYNRKDY